MGDQPIIKRQRLPQLRRDDEEKGVNGTKNCPVIEVFGGSPSVSTGAYTGYKYAGNCGTEAR